MISDARLISAKYADFNRKLAERHYWTADDYNSIPDDLVVEIYDGAVYVVPSPNGDHQVVSADLLEVFRSAAADKHLVYQDYDVNVLGKIYKPDLLVLRSRSRLQPMPGDMLQVVVEVISPSENIERTAKKSAYAAQGIPLYIIVDGKEGAHFAEVFRLVGGVYELLTTVAADSSVDFSDPFPFTLDMRYINS
jgi:Uma2 family endonuclease